MSRRKAQFVQDLEIVDIAHKGLSIAKDRQGKVYLLRGGVPGDKVNAIIRRKKKGLPFGDVKEIVQNSAFRINPICDHFGLCGGCKWQNLNYSKQLILKEKQVSDAVSRIAHISDAQMEPILASEQQYGYRNKMEYTFTSRRYLSNKEVGSDVHFSDRRGLGFHRSGAFDQVVAIEKCYLQEDIGNKIRNKILEQAKELNISFYDNKSHFGVLRNLLIRTSSLGGVMVTLVLAESIFDTVERIFKPIIPLFPEVESWNYVINTKLNDSLEGCHTTCYHGQNHIIEVLGTKKYIVSPLSFFQTNSFQAKCLYDQVKKYAEEKSFRSVYDLYCGTGSIGIYLSDLCNKIYGIEQNPHAINDAHINAKLNQLKHTKFFVGDVVKIMTPSFLEEHGKPELLVTDPPRAGMHAELVQFLKNIQSERIIYVSCNPSTFARDMVILSDTYRLTKYRAIDMFPQTSHIETVALLEIKNE